MKAFQLWISIILMLMLATLIIFIKVIKDEQTKCIKEPLTYGIKSIEDSSAYPFTCQCISGKPNTNPVIITSEGIKPFVVDNQNNYKPFNLSIIEAVPNE